MRTVVLITLIMATLCASGRRREISSADTIGYRGPNIGNGQLGATATRGGLTATNVFSRSVTKVGNESRVSTITRAIEPINLLINGHNLEGAEDWRQTLDMDSAAIVTRGIIDGLEVESRLMALRALPHSLMVSVRVKALREGKVTVSNCPLIPEGLDSGRVENRRVWCEDGGKHVTRAQARYNGGSDAVVATSVFLAPEPWHVIDGSTIEATLSKGETAEFAIVGNVVSTTDFSDPWNESERMALYADRQGKSRLLQTHRKAWEKLWQSSVEIEGDSRLQEITDVALYSLYSSINGNGPQSIAPMGLTSDKYYGHIFWDADMWIHPVLASLHPELSRSMVDYRTATLPAARRRAAAYGYDGAMYAWESDDNGEESTPTFALTGPLEHHITADVALAVWRQYQAEGDKQWLAKAYPMIEACADFWVSRSTKHSDGRRSIDNVVGADEYAISVDNNAFTNGAAIRALEIADSAAAALNIEPKREWSETALGLGFSRNSEGIIMEYEGYDGAKIKQADVALLAYPLGFITDPEEIKRTINYYEPHLDKEHGPAMSHAVMAVNYARMGDGETAYRTLMQGVEPYMEGAFHSFAETPSNGETYFMTGAGALLQGLIYGFAHPEAALPPHIKSVRVVRQ